VEAARSMLAHEFRVAAGNESVLRNANVAIDSAYDGVVGAEAHPLAIELAVI